jgi:hypothetical protein
MSSIFLDFLATRNLRGVEGLTKGSCHSQQNQIGSTFLYSNKKVL